MSKFNPPEFYERLARSYPEESINSMTENLKALNAFVYAYLDAAHGSLMDLGCGQGRYSVYYKNGEVWGVDIAPTNIKVARIRARIAGDGVKRTFAAVDITKPLPYSGFDNLICIEVIEHLPEPGSVFANIKNILKPGGTALITVPPAPADPWVTSDELKEFGITDRYYHGGYAPGALADMIKAAGLGIAESGSIPNSGKTFVKAVKN